MPVTDQHDGDYNSADEQSERFNKLIDAAQAGRINAEEFMVRFPQHSDLGALLHVVEQIRELPQPPMPEGDKGALRQQLMAQFRAQAQARAKSQSAPSRRRTRLQPLFRLAIAFSILVFVMIAGGAGLARAAESAVPGDSLYGFKRFVEQLELFFATSDLRPDLLYSMAQKRLAELGTLASRGEPLSDEVLADAATGVNAALTEQPNAEKRRALVNETVAVLEQARSQGMLSAAMMGQVLGALAVPPDEARPAITPSPTLTATLTGTPTATATSTPTLTATLTLTLTFTSTTTPVPTATTMPSVMPTSTAMPSFTSTPSPPAPSAPTTPDPEEESKKLIPTRRPSITPRPRPTQKPNPGQGGDKDPKPPVGPPPR